jgi:hypothetical protein
MSFKPTGRQAAIPLPRLVGHRQATTFEVGHLRLIISTVPYKPRQSEASLAEALNDAVVNYLASFAIAHAGTPSEQARWTSDLRAAADNCLEMIRPGFARKHPPGRPAPAAYSALFHNGGPILITDAHLRWLGFDSELNALDKITDALWLLRTFADNAEQGWRTKTAAPAEMNRRKVRAWPLTWVSDLGRIYAETFGKLPSTTSSKAPFVRFSEAIRVRVIAAPETVTDNGTDPEAYRELGHFSSGSLISFAKRHRTLLRTRWALGLESIQDRFKFDIAPEMPPADVARD